MYSDVPSFTVFPCDMDFVLLTQPCILRTFRWQAGSLAAEVFDIPHHRKDFGDVGINNVSWMFLLKWSSVKYFTMVTLTWSGFRVNPLEMNGIWVCLLFLNLQALKL